MEASEQNKAPGQEGRKRAGNVTANQCPVKCCILVDLFALSTKDESVLRPRTAGGICCYLSACFFAKPMSREDLNMNLTLENPV